MSTFLGNTKNKWNILNKSHSDINIVSHWYLGLMIEVVRHGWVSIGPGVPVRPERSVEKDENIKNVPIHLGILICIKLYLAK